MPVYTYECEECGHTADKLRSLEHRDEPLMCGECNGECIRVTRKSNESKNTKKDW